MYVGHAKVEVCNAKDSPYILSGCAPYINCVTPASTVGYIITETGTELHNWDVRAQCAPLFHGAAKVEECDKNGSPYGISGCAPDTCLEPEDTIGYTLTTASLELHKFGVTAECSYGYIGDPKVVKCSGHGKPYTLDGCEQTTTTTSTTTTTTTTTVDGVCLAPPDAGVAYTVTELDLEWSKFNVRATCGPRHYGHAHVFVCGTPDMVYSLTGCTKVVTCKTPADTTGYHLKETSLDTHRWDVTATCAPHFVVHQRSQSVRKTACTMQFLAASQTCAFALAD